MAAEREPHMPSDESVQAHTDASACRQRILAEIVYLRTTEIGAELPPMDIAAGAEVIDAYAERLKRRGMLPDTFWPVPRRQPE